MSAAFIILRQKRIIRRFADAGAWSPDTARTTDEVGCGQNWLFERLLARGVLHRAGDDRYHLDAEGIRRYRHRLRTFAAVSLILMGIGIAVLALV